MSDLSNVPTSELLKSLSNEDLKRIAGIGAPTPERQWSDVPGEALSNVIPSAGKFASGAIQPLLHPVKTMEGISRVARGALGINKEEQQTWDATKQFFVDRYGSEEALKKTIATDPVGFAADVSTILTAGGSLAGKAPGLLGKVGTGLSTAGEWTNPATIPLKAGAAVANKVASSSIPTNLYTSALKPSTALTAEERIKRVKTALREQIPVSEYGLQKLEEGISDLNRDVSHIVVDATMSGKYINKKSLMDKLDGLNEYYATNYLDPRPYMTAVEKAKEGLNLKPDRIPLGQAQSIKQTIYSEIKNAYDSAKKVGAEQEATGFVTARKNLAFNIKQELENVVPEIKNLNARESAMISLNESIEKAVGRISNWDLLGLAAPVVGAAGGATPISKVSVTLLYRILGNPTVKSNLAIALSKTRKVSPMAGAIPLATRGANLLTENP